MATASAAPAAARTLRDPIRGEFIAGDPLRGLGALMVMTAHVAIATIYTTGRYTNDFFSPYGSVGAKLFNNLDIAVTIFFVLSGYLLARPFIGAFVEDRPFPGVVRYLEGRALRVVPGLWAGFLVALLAFGTLGSSFTQLAAVPLFAQAYHLSQFASTATSHYWTLDVEAVFYLLLPIGGLGLALVGRRGTTRGLRVALALAGLALVCGVSIWLRARHPYTYSDYQHRFPVWLCTFAAGVALAVIELVVPDRVSGCRGGRPLALAAVAAGLGALLGYVLIPRSRLLLGGVLLVGGVGLVVGGALLRQWTDGRCWRALDNRVLHWVGKRSYSIYIFHVSILHVITQHVRGGGLWHVFALTWVIELPLAMLAGWVGFALVERPFMRRRPRWRMPPPAPPVEEPPRAAVAAGAP